jgi:uncharacterized damage-inducible protein DinB
MSLQKLISNYSAYNAWATHRLIGWLQSVDTELLYQEIPSSYTSIDYTLQHMLRTQRYWLLFLTGKDVSNHSWAVREREVDQIMSELIFISGQMKEEFGRFSEADLLEVLHLRSPWAQNDLPRYEYIQHIINHNTYHRGQIITIARNVGLTNVVNTDYNFFNTPHI